MSSAARRTGLATAADLAALPGDVAAEGRDERVRAAPFEELERVSAELFGG